MSALSKKILGEAVPPKPSELFKATNPRSGAETKFKWRIHRVLGVAPTGIPADVYEEWLEEMALRNVNSEMPTNHMSMAELVDRAKLDQPRNPDIAAFLVEVEQLARHLGADEVAFTDLEGL